jgi:hypothetical protein
MSTPRTTARFVVTAAAALLGVAALSGCSVLENVFPAQAQRDDETQEIAEAGQQDVFEVAVGDCFNNEGEIAEGDTAEGDTGEVSDIPAVPCAEPHDNEIFYLFDLAGDEFPTDVDILADDGCYAQFATFVGLDYESSTLDYFPIMPTAETWAQGDREVICSVFADTQTTGTLAAAAR